MFYFIHIRRFQEDKYIEIALIVSYSCVCIIHEFMCLYNILKNEIFVFWQRTMCTFGLHPLCGGFCSSKFLTYEFLIIYISVK